MVGLFLQLGKRKNLMPKIAGRIIYYSIIHIVTFGYAARKRLLVTLLVRETNRVAGDFTRIRLSCEGENDRGIAIAGIYEALVDYVVAHANDTIADDIRTAEWLQLRGLNVAPTVVSRAVGAVARELRLHPVRDWLDTLTWDGTPRIETWTSTYLGAEPTAFL